MGVGQFCGDVELKVGWVVDDFIPQFKSKGIALFDNFV